LRAVPDADAEILALDSLDTRNEAVFNASRFPDLKPATFARDSTAAITLEEYRPNQLTYHSSNSGEGLAVFSEMYYPEGWQAYLDGNKVSHFRVNYVLRALTIPAGEHTVVFRFEPAVVETGSRISLASSIILALLILTGT